MRVLAFVFLASIVLAPVSDTQTDGSPSVEFELQTRVVGEHGSETQPVRFGGLVIEKEGNRIVALVPRFPADILHPSGAYPIGTVVDGFSAVEGASREKARLAWLPRWDPSAPWAVAVFQTPHPDLYSVFRPIEEPLPDRVNVSLRIGQRVLVGGRSLEAVRPVNHARYEMESVKAFADSMDVENLVPFGTALQDERGRTIGLYLPDRFLESLERLFSQARRWEAYKTEARAETKARQREAETQSLVAAGALLYSVYSGGIGLVFKGIKSASEAQRLRSLTGRSEIVRAEGWIEQARNDFRRFLEKERVTFVPIGAVPRVLLRTWWDDRCHITFSLPDPGWSFRFDESSSVVARFQNEEWAYSGQYRVLAGLWTESEAKQHVLDWMKSLALFGERATWTPVSPPSEAGNGRLDSCTTHLWQLSFLENRSVVRHGCVFVVTIRNTAFCFFVTGPDDQQCIAACRAIGRTFDRHRAEVNLVFVRGDFSTLRNVDTREMGKGPEISLALSAGGKRVLHAFLPAGTSPTDRAKLDVFTFQKDVAAPTWNRWVSFPFCVGDDLEFEVYEIDAFTRKSVYCIDNVQKNGEGQIQSCALNVIAEVFGATGPTRCRGHYKNKAFEFAMEVRTDYFHPQLHGRNERR